MPDTINEVRGSDMADETDHRGPSDPEKAAIHDNITALTNDPYLVRFKEPFDSESPKDWPMRKKFLVTLILGSGGFNRIMVSTIMAPALSTIGREFHMGNTDTVVSMSVFLIATAFGPLLFGPLSELHGRKPVLFASNIFALAWNMACGFAHSKALLITARMLTGLGASSIYALGYGVLSDVWSEEQRGKSMAIYTLIMLTAPACGPILGGYIVEYTTWRWMFWSTSALQVMMIGAELFIYRESYGPIILQRRAKMIRKQTGESRYYTAAERLDEGRTVVGVVRWSLSRPLRLLAFHPVIQFIAIYSGLMYGLLYLLITTYASLWMKQYHESISRSSLHYLAEAAGEIVAAQAGAPLMDLTFLKLKARAGGVIAPEYRLPLLFPSVLIIGCGLLCYGWAAQYHVYWLVVDIGVFILCFGFGLSGNAMLGYVIDAYGEYASSASAAAQVLRSLAAFAFPLFAPAMYDDLGYGWGNTLIALVTITFGTVAPAFMWRYGATLRSKARAVH